MFGESGWQLKHEQWVITIFIGDSGELKCINNYDEHDGQHEWEPGWPKDDFPHVLSSMITTNLREEERAAGSWMNLLRWVMMAVGKINNWFTYSLMVEIGGELKSYNDDNKHCRAQVWEQYVVEASILLRDNGGWKRGWSGSGLKRSFSFEKGEISHQTSYYVK